MLEKNEQEQAAIKEDIAKKNEEKKKQLELKKRTGLKYKEILIRCLEYENQKN